MVPLCLRKCIQVWAFCVNFQSSSKAVCFVNVLSLNWCWINYFTINQLYHDLWSWTSEKRILENILLLATNLEKVVVSSNDSFNVLSLIESSEVLSESISEINWLFSVVTNELLRDNSFSSSNEVNVSTSALVSNDLTESGILFSL